MGSHNEEIFILREEVKRKKTIVEFSTKGGWRRGSARSHFPIKKEEKTWAETLEFA